MDASKVLHMNGGFGENSYARNSSIQKSVISMTKPIIKEAVTALYSSTTLAELVIADLGCSSCLNTLHTVLEIVRAVEDLCKAAGHRPLEYQVFLNDLPGNDFNTLFGMLPDFLEKHMKERMLDGEESRCFFAGVPGSFYGRLFPRNSLHFVHSACSLHWLSKVILHNAPNRNINCILFTKPLYSPYSGADRHREQQMEHLHGEDEPPNVLKAYREQFHEDFTMFLDCQAVEIVRGGCLVLTIAGRRSEDLYSNGCCYVWELLAKALKEMVSEGLVEEEKLDNFNVQGYTPSLEELKSEIENQGSFSISNLVVFQVNWSAYDKKKDQNAAFDDDSGGHSLVKCVRAAVEPILVDHFGDGIIEECWERYGKLFVDGMDKEEKDFLDICVSLIRT